MIKLVASDLDGTILLNGAQEVDDSLVEVVDQLVRSGVIFAPASGRQCESLRRLFAPIADQLMYIGENGALVRYHNETIAKTPMDYNLAMDIIDDVYKIKNCEVLISGENTAYIKPKSKEYEYRMTKVVKYHTTFVDDFRDIKEDILKIAICDLSGIEHSKEYLLSRWGDQTAAAVSGSQYLDYTDQKVSKGYAIKQVQERLNIKPSECMAFGDNFNDITMLDAVEHSYVMEKAVEEIKRHGKYRTAWVEGTLRKTFSI